jgi:hypothetical protein
MRTLPGLSLCLVVALFASAAASGPVAKSALSAGKCPRLSEASQLAYRPGGGRLRGDVDGDGRRDEVSIRYAPSAPARCGIVLVVETRSKNFALRVAWEYEPEFVKIAARDVSTPEPFVAAIVRLGPRGAQIVIARHHGAANAFVSFIGVVRAKLVLLPFQPREYADELSLFGSVGTGVTNAWCSRGGPLVVLGLGPTSYTGRRWSFTRTEYRLAGGRLRKTRSRTIRSSRRCIEGFAHVQGFDALPFTGCMIARGRRI